MVVYYSNKKETNTKAGTRELSYCCDRPGLDVWPLIGETFGKDYELWPWKSCFTGFEISEAHDIPS